MFPNHWIFQRAGIRFVILAIFTFGKNCLFCNFHYWIRFCFSPTSASRGTFENFSRSLWDTISKHWSRLQPVNVEPPRGRDWVSVRASELPSAIQPRSYSSSFIWRRSSVWLPLDYTIGRRKDALVKNWKWNRFADSSVIPVEKKGLKFQVFLLRLRVVCLALQLVGLRRTRYFNHQRSLSLEMCVSRLSLEPTAKVPKHQTQIYNLPPLWH